MRYHVVALLCTLASPSAFANQDFSCGPAHVVVTVEPNADRSQDFDFAGVLTVETQGHQTVLQYRGDIDFLGATCAVDERGAPLVLFQASCGGSGCHDLDNWGLINPRSLRVELLPTDHNREETQRRLGGKKPCTDVVSLSAKKVTWRSCAG